MSATPTQVCAACAARFAVDVPLAACAECGGLLEIAHELDGLDAGLLRAEFLSACCTRPGAIASGVWRYRRLIHAGLTADALVSHPEGNTPLLHRPALDRYTGLDGLLIKHEGHNPTGSFKDRGMTVAVTMAKRLGARAVACASTGNTSAALAAYAAQAGLPALVFIPDGKIAMGKLAQTIASGARTLQVRGDFDACLRLVREASEALGIYLVNSVNPWRLEGQKTIVLELLQQLDWQVPDWIVLPAGNLGNTAAFGKALREAQALGLISHLPRIACVQAAGAAPFAAAFDEQFRTRHVVTPETVATAIRIGDPASWDRAVRTITETDGVVLAVRDEEILAAKAAVDGCGVGCEPASAASVAGVRRLVADGRVRAGDRVVAVLTGHVLKDPGILLDRLASADPSVARPVQIAPTIDAVAEVLR
jgi:threonine synthase